ncbi:hypothetical protein ABVB72_12030 [Rhizobium nepotum]|uniref:hypothetical protein n=1 Tax=Rhizobium nepotum TaxID=1035271 RepID=UPI00336A731C
MKNMQRVLPDYNAPKQTVRQLPAKAFTARLSLARYSGKKKPSGGEGSSGANLTGLQGRMDGGERSVRDMNAGKDERFHSSLEYSLGPAFSCCL